MMAILEVVNVQYGFQDGENKRVILDNISAGFEKGKFHAILGDSGSGKTTFLSLISALDKPHGGQILFENKDINRDIGAEKYRRNHIGMVFQAYNLIPFMTAAENVRVAMSITENDLPADEASVAYNLLDHIGITRDKADRTVNKLSGGEQQRVAIARALSTNVDLILADEPTGNLNEEMEAEIVNILKNLAHEHDKCVVVVTHSKDIAAQADVIFKLKGGQFLDE
ncbi:MAG: ABC transporter ATP-binding protein [Defluviitaleaceae bacterium]|nr:ABC transporter ATP-binding protein [Defluviitaleaceae bacterium]